MPKKNLIKSSPKKRRNNILIATHVYMSAWPNQRDSKNHGKSNLKKALGDSILSDGPYSCSICGDSISGETSWHDKYGHSCILCRNARRKRIISPVAYKNRESWYSVSELEIEFKVPRPIITRYIKEGKLKARVVLSLTGRPHYYLFMLKDNKGLLLQSRNHDPFHWGTADSRWNIEKVKSPFK